MNNEGKPPPVQAQSHSKNKIKCPKRIETYLLAGGRPDAQSDIDRLDVYGQEHFKREVQYLLGTARSIADWREPHAKKLQGYEDLWEIRWKGSRKQKRAIGCLGPAEATFTILIICDHKDNVYAPASALDTARQRRTHLFSGIGATQPLEVDGEVFPPLPEQP